MNFGSLAQQGISQSNCREFHTMGEQEMNAKLASLDGSAKGGQRGGEPSKSVTWGRS